MFWRSMLGVWENLSSFRGFYEDQIAFLAFSDFSIEWTKLYYLHAWYLWNSHVTRDACTYQVRDEDVLLVCECDRTRSRTEPQCLSHLYGFSWHASGPFCMSRRSRSTSMTCALMYGSHWEHLRPQELFLSWSSDGIPDHAAVFSDRNWGKCFDARRWRKADISDTSHAYREWCWKAHPYRQ